MVSHRTPSSEDLHLLSLGDSQFTVKELRHVLYLHETLRFNRAAELAGISQSALSQSIANLEKRLGVLLFNRNRRTVSSTMFGELIAERAVAVLNALDDIDDHIEALRESREGSVAFGMGILPAGIILDAAMAKFYEWHPEVHLKTVVGYPHELFEKLLQGEIEFFVAGRDPQFHDTMLDTQPLFDEQFMLLCRAGHPLTSERSVDCRSIIHYPLVTYDTVYFRRQIYQQLTTSDEFALLNRNFPAIALQQPSLLVNFVEHSDHLMLAPASMIRERLHPDRLVAVEVANLDLKISVELVKKKGFKLSPANERMVEAMHEVVRERHLDT